MYKELSNIEIIMMELEINKNIIVDMTNEIVNGLMPNDTNEAIDVINQAEYQIGILIEQLKVEL